MNNTNTKESTSDLVDKVIALLEQKGEMSSREIRHSIGMSSRCFSSFILAVDSKCMLYEYDKDKHTVYGIYKKELA